MQAQAPLETADLAWAFAGVCRLLHVEFDPRLFLQQHPPPVCAATVRVAAAALGLEATSKVIDGRQSLRPDQTGIAFAHGGKGTPRALALLASLGQDTILVSARNCEPRSLTRREFAQHYEPEILLLEKSRAVQDSDAVAPPFGLGWFIPELLRHRSVWRDVLAASLALQLVALATPLLTQVVIDKVIVHHAQSTLIVVVVALAIFLVFNAFISYIRQYLLLHTGNRIDAVLGARVFEHLLRLAPRYFEHRPTGTLVARLHGVDTIREFLTGAAASVALDLPFVVVFLAIMLWYSVPLTLIAVAAIAALALLSVLVTPLLRRRINQQFLASARNQAFLTEYVSAMDTVKALQLEPQLATRYSANLADVLAAGFATRHLSNVYAVSAAALEQALNVAVLAAGAWLVMTSEGFTIGMLVAFQMFAVRLAQPALRLSGLWQEFQQASIAVQRLGDLMDAPAEPWSTRSGRSRSAPGKIDIDKLAFRYAEDQPALFENFNLHIEPGACVALTGPSGSGKSTLGRLLLGFYFPSHGAIRIDGHDTRHLAANELRLQFGVVPQETRLFSGTIYENLVLAQPYASFAEVLEACKLAEIHDFIDALPQGYQSGIGEHGAGLSGGQKQRIAIARALLRRPRILLCDEATASLDQSTSEALGRTISRLRGKVTIVFIAHHLPDSLGIDLVARLDRTPARSLETDAPTNHAVTP